VNFTETDLDILARTVYGEGRGELYRFGIASLIAIANVVVNRKNKNFAKTIAEVCLMPHQFSCWNKNDVNYSKITNISDNDSVFKICTKTAENILTEKWPDLTDGCDHYHEKTDKPFWAAHLQPKRIFGSHCFYELRRTK
jgi:spore germination cell wall hydrolase CwlJ-like protein